MASLIDPEGVFDFTDAPRTMAGAKPARRGTSNGNSAGSAEDRRRRKVWLRDTYRADVDVLPYHEGADTLWEEVPRGMGVTACRCYRCGKLLTLELITVDRIKPGCEGGTYARTNIRPACRTCNESTGGKLAHRKRKTCKCTGLEHRNTCPAWVLPL